MVNNISSALASSIANLRSQSVRVGVSADNIANLRSQGVPPGQAPQTGQFTPRKVDQVSLNNGGSLAIIRDVNPAWLNALDRSQEGGSSFIPNISLAGELVEQLIASKSYEASLKVIQTVEEMTRKAVDLKS